MDVVDLLAVAQEMGAVERHPLTGSPDADIDGLAGLLDEAVSIRAVEGTRAGAACLLAGLLHRPLVPRRRAAFAVAATEWFLAESYDHLDLPVAEDAANALASIAKDGDRGLARALIDGRDTEERARRFLDTTAPPARFAYALRRLEERIHAAVWSGSGDVGGDENRRFVRLLLLTMSARGHLLVESPLPAGVPSLLRDVARAAGLTVARVDGGGMAEDARDLDAALESNIVIVDSIDRLPGRLQSHLLEAMAERRIPGTERPTPDPFLVVATTAPETLSPAVSDRFLATVEIRPRHRRPDIAMGRALRPRPDGESIESAREEGDAELRWLLAPLDIDVPSRVEDFIVRLVWALRADSRLAAGPSPRATIGLAKLGRAVAASQGHSAVALQDVRLIALDVLRHRLETTEGTPVEEVLESHL